MSTIFSVVIFDWNVFLSCWRTTAYTSSRCVTRGGKEFVRKSNKKKYPRADLFGRLVGSRSCQQMIAIQNSRKLTSSRKTSTTTTGRAKKYINKRGEKRRRRNRLREQLVFPAAVFLYSMYRLNRRPNSSATSRFGSIDAVNEPCRNSGEEDWYLIIPASSLLLRFPSKSSSPLFNPTLNVSTSWLLSSLWCTKSWLAGTHTHTHTLLDVEVQRTLLFLSVNTSTRRRTTTATVPTDRPRLIGPSPAVDVFKLH